jgi:hypothetical protein
MANAPSNGRYRPTIDDNFRPGDRGRPVRGGENDKLRDFLGPDRPSERNPAKHVHELLSRRRVVAFGPLRHSLNHARGGILMKPGETVRTRIALGLNSLASALLKLVKAAFAAALANVGS